MEPRKLPGQDVWRTYGHSSDPVAHVLGRLKTANGDPVYMLATALNEVFGTHTLFSNAEVPRQRPTQSGTTAVARLLRRMAEHHEVRYAPTRAMGMGGVERFEAIFLDIVWQFSNPSGDSEGSECGDIGLAQGRGGDSVIDDARRVGRCLSEVPPKPALKLP